MKNLTRGLISASVIVGASAGLGYVAMDAGLPSALATPTEGQGQENGQVSINPLSFKASEITGTAKPGTFVHVFNEAGTIDSIVKSDLATGAWSAPAGDGVLKTGMKITATATRYKSGQLRDQTPYKVNVNAKAPSMAEQFNPRGKDLQYNVGDTPDPKAGIENSGDLPEDTRYSFNGEVDNSKAQTIDAKVKVEYSDGTSEDVQIKITFVAKKTAVDANNLKAVSPTNTLQDTGIKVINSDSDTYIHAKDEDGIDIPVVFEKNGDVKVTPGESVDGPITIKITDPDLPDGAVDVVIQVDGQSKGVDDNHNGNPSSGPEFSVDAQNIKPVSPGDIAQNTGIVVNERTKDTYISAYDEDGKVIYVEFFEDGGIYATPGEEVDGPITVHIKDTRLPKGEMDITVPVFGHDAGKDDNYNGNPYEGGDYLIPPLSVSPLLASPISLMNLMSPSSPAEIDKNAIVRLEAVSSPSKLDYEDGEAFDPSGITAKITDAYGKSMIVPYEDFEQYYIKMAPSPHSNLELRQNGNNVVLDMPGMTVVKEYTTEQVVSGEKREVKIPHDKKIIEDENMLVGTEEITTPGKDGKKIVETDENGKVLHEEIIEDQTPEEKHVGIREEKKIVIPVSEKVVEDPDLYEDETKTTDEGEPGEKVEIYIKGELKDSKVTKEMKPKTVHKGTKPVNTYKDIEVPFQKEYIDDETLPKGTEKIKTPGVNGKSRQLYVKGEKTDTIEVISNPVNEVVLVGTLEVVEEEIPFDVEFIEDETMADGDVQVDKPGAPGKKKVYKSKGKVLKEETIKEPVSEVKRTGVRVVATEEVPFETQEIEDDTLPKGTNKTVQEGKPGKKEVYTSKKSGKTLGEKVIEESTPKIVHVGVLETKEEEIPFTTKHVDDENLLKGQSKVQQKGKNGKKQVKIVKGNIIGEEVIEKATEEIIHDGVLEVREEAIPHKTISEEDETLDKGKQEVSVPGKDGKKKVYFVGDKVVKEETIEEPTDEVVKVGTVETIIEEIHPSIKEVEDPTQKEGVETVEEGKPGKKEIKKSKDKIISERVIEEPTPTIKHKGIIKEKIEDIPFDTELVEDDTLKPGEKQVDQEGKPGKKRVEYLPDGTIVKEEILEKPTPAKVRVNSKPKQDGEKPSFTTKIEEVPFKTIKQYEETLDKGKEFVFKEGKPGKKEVYIDNKTGEKIGEKVIEKPQDKIIVVGSLEKAKGKPSDPVDTNKGKDNKPNENTGNKDKNTQDSKDKNAEKDHKNDQGNKDKENKQISSVKDNKDNNKPSASNKPSDKHDNQSKDTQEKDKSKPKVKELVKTGDINPVVVASAGAVALAGTIAGAFAMRRRTE